MDKSINLPMSKSIITGIKPYPIHTYLRVIPLDILMSKLAYVGSDKQLDYGNLRAEKLYQAIFLILSFLQMPTPPPLSNLNTNPKYFHKLYIPLCNQLPQIHSVCCVSFAFVGDYTLKLGTSCLHSCVNCCWCKQSCRMFGTAFNLAKWVPVS